MEPEVGNLSGRNMAVSLRSPSGAAHCWGTCLESHAVAEPVSESPAVSQDDLCGQ